MRKQKASMVETCEHATKMKAELEKRLEVDAKDIDELKRVVQEKQTELQLLKTESEKAQINFMSTNQVLTIGRLFDDAYHPPKRKKLNSMGLYLFARITKTRCKSYAMRKRTPRLMWKR